MTRLPSLVPVIAGALAASAGALFLVGWHGRPLAGAFAVAASALGIVSLLLLLRMSASGAPPGGHSAKPERRRLPTELLASAYTLEHASYIGGLDDTELADIVDAWTDTDSWVGPAAHPAPLRSPAG